jgi:serpin B
VAGVLTIGLVPLVAVSTWTPGAQAKVTGAATNVKAYGMADTAFGLDLLHAWCAQTPRRNIVLSPSGIASGLGMAYLGARGATAKELEHTLHLPATGTALLTGLHTRSAALGTLAGHGITLDTSDQVWADTALPPRAGYLERIATGYGARLRSLPIRKDPEGSRRQINSAIGKATARQITDLLAPGSLSAGIGWVLTDAVYLDAHWHTGFDPNATRPGPFSTADRRTVTTSYLHREDELGYAHAPGWIAVTLPYSGSRLIMQALLPDTPATGCPALTPALLNRLTAGTTSTRLSLALPKIRLSSQQDLTPLLTRLGMGDTFAAGADFTGLSPAADHLGFVEHAATMQVDEAGTKAAAATTIGLVGEALPSTPTLTVTFDRPYLLIVRDTRTSEPLFIARVTDPSQP